MANLQPLVIQSGQVRQIQGSDTLNAIALNRQIVTANLSIPSGFNAILAAPITVASGISFTITPSSRVVIL